MSDHFTCECCGQSYQKGWSDTEALSEFAEKFPVESASGESTCIVCEHCMPIVDAAAAGASKAKLQSMLRVRLEQIKHEGVT